MAKFKKGDKVFVVLRGFGETTYEAGFVLEVSKGKVWLDNGPGNNPSGPFNSATGRHEGPGVPGFSKSIEPDDDLARVVKESNGG